MAQLQTEQAILEELACNPPLHVMDLTDRIAAHPIVIDQACASLHDDGSLRACGQGVYDITDQGRNRIATDSSSMGETPLEE